MRKKLIVAFTFLGGIYYFLDFVLPKTIAFSSDPKSPWHTFQFAKYNDQISSGFIIITTMAVFLGMINILRSHGMSIIMQRKRWGYSLALVAAMFITMIAGFWDWHNSAADRNAANVRRQIIEKKFKAANDAWVAAGKKGDAPKREDFSDLTPEEKARIAGCRPAEFSRAMGKIYGELLMGLDGLFTALSSAMFSLLALYIATAAYRAFRIRSGEAALMMFTALLVMMGQIPIGGEILDGLLAKCGLDCGIAGVRGWIMKYINAAAFRGIAFGAFIAMLAMGIRVWLSMETGSFYQEEE